MVLILPIEKGVCLASLQIAKIVQLPAQTHSAFVLGSVLCFGLLYLYGMLNNIFRSDQWDPAV